MTASVLSRSQQRCVYWPPNLNECRPVCHANFSPSDQVGPSSTTISPPGVLQPRLVAIDPSRRPNAVSSLIFSGAASLMLPPSRVASFTLYPNRVSDVQLVPART